MKKYSFRITAILSMFVLSLTACTNVDKTLGLNMIPDDEQLTLVTDTLYPSIYNVTLDSVRLVNLQYNSFGSYFDPIFGTTTAGFTFQMIPSYDTVDFGTEHTVDSVILYMITDSRTGEDDYEQELKIYEVNQQISKDSIYYPCMDMNTMINTIPVGTKQYKRTPKDRWETSDTLRIHLDNSLGEKLLATPEEALDLDSIHLFLEHFKGLHITTENVNAGTTGRMNRTSVSSTGTYLILYYKRDGTDTTTMYTHYAGGMAAFTTVKHDYTTATHPLKVNTETLNDTSQIIPPDSILYVQGLFGVAPMIKIRKQSVLDWLTAKNLEVGELAISRVVLEVDVERFSGYDVTRFATPLGLFYRSLLVDANDGDTLKYPHLTSINELNSSSFNGNLNRTLYKYPMKITYDFTSIVKNLDKANVAIMYISPYSRFTSTDYYGQESYSYVENQTLLYQTLLKGSASTKPPRLIITYAKSKY